MDMCSLMEKTIYGYHWRFLNGIFIWMILMRAATNHQNFLIVPCISSHNSSSYSFTNISSKIISYTHFFVYFGNFRITNNFCSSRLWTRLILCLVYLDFCANKIIFEGRKRTFTFSKCHYFREEIAINWAWNINCSQSQQKSKYSNKNMHQQQLYIVYPFTKAVYFMPATAQLALFQKQKKTHMNKLF